MEDITVVMIDSRSSLHPQMVQTAIHSVKQQYHKVKLLVVDNRDLSKTIGQCWNYAVKQCETEWILFMGDDDWLSRDYTYCLSKFAQEQPGMDAITTGMTFYNPTGQQIETSQQNTGMWRREYLLKHPFNEKLKKGIDREYVEEAAKRNVRVGHLVYHHGIFVRIHEDSKFLTKRPHVVDPPKHIYFNARYPTFIQPVVDKLKYQGFDVAIDNHDFDERWVTDCKVIWCDWADNNAYYISKLKTDAKKILRLHSYEAYTPTIHYIDFDAFDVIIFVAEHVKEHVEHQLGRALKNAIMIPNGINMKEFTIAENKQKNNKVAYAGDISRKKGLPLLLAIAEHFPQYEFHVAGKFSEPDMAEFFNQRKAANVFLEPYSYNLNEFFADKTYFLLTSPREGCNVTTLQAMAAGLYPLVYDHVGAEKIFPHYSIWRSVKKLEQIFKFVGKGPKDHREFVLQNNNFHDMYINFKVIIDELIKDYDSSNGALQHSGTAKQRGKLNQAVLS